MRWLASMRDRDFLAILALVRRMRDATSHDYRIGFLLRFVGRRLNAVKPAATEEAFPEPN